MPEAFFFAVPGDITNRTGGTIYDRKVMRALQARSWPVTLLSWPSRFPFPSASDLAQTAASLAALPDNALVMIDGLAFGAMPEIVEREATRLRLVALVHHPLARESGLSAGDVATLAASERRALARARAVIVTSDTTAAILRNDFTVPDAKITVATPGVEILRRNEPRTPGAPRLFAMGSVVPRKAHHILVEALALIAELDWSCTIAGSLDLDPEISAGLQQLIAQKNLEGRIALIGQASEEQAAMLYSQADIFALASLYEGYGMVFSEALAHGLPIVATTGGAIPEVVPPDAGILVPPEDAKAFADALRVLLCDPHKRATLADGARTAGALFPGWDQTAARIEACLESV